MLGVRPREKPPGPTPTRPEPTDATSDRVPDVCGNVCELDGIIVVAALTRNTVSTARRKTAAMAPACVSHERRVADTWAVGSPVSAPGLAFRERRSVHQRKPAAPRPAAVVTAGQMKLWSLTCLLYTSDAADEEDSVDLG